MSFLCCAFPTDVIHTVGPVARGHVGNAETNDLTSCYQNSLKLVMEHGLSTVVSIVRRNPMLRPISVWEEFCLCSLQLQIHELYVSVLFFLFFHWVSFQQEKAVFENLRKFGQGTRTKGFSIFHLRYSSEKPSSLLKQKQPRTQKMVTLHVCQMKAFLCRLLCLDIKWKASFCIHHSILKHQE